MDGGKLEKDRAAHFKRIVKQNKRRNPSCNSQQEVTLSNTTLLAPLLCQEGAPAPDFLSSASAGGSNATHEYAARESGDIYSGGPQLSNLDLLCLVPSTMSSHAVTPQDTSALSSNQRQVILDSEEAWFDRNGVVTPNSELHSPSSSHGNDYWIDSAMTTETNGILSITAASSSVNTADPRAQSMPRSLTPAAPELAASYFTSLADLDRYEATLLMYYLDHSFYCQFPFYTSSTNGGRGWILNTWMNDKSVYHAAFALCRQHQRSIITKLGDVAEAIPQSLDNIDYYTLATGELRDKIASMHTWVGATCLTSTIQALTSSLFLLYFEVWLKLVRFWVDKVEFR